MSPTGSGTSQYHLSAGAVRLPSPGKMSKTAYQSIWQQRRRRWAPWWGNWVWAGISPGHRTALGQATFVSAFPLGCSNGVDGEIKHSILPNRWAIHDRAEAAVTNVRSRPVRGNLSTKSTVQRSGTMKSEFELTQMIMAELRKHLECTEVDRVLLLRPVFAVNGANWDIAVGRSARRINRRSRDAEGAIARDLQEQYDVSD